MPICLKGEFESDSTSIRTLCPIRWTARTQFLASVDANYGDLQWLWEEALIKTSDTEMKARIRGIASQIETF